jgi:hypothetical protein
LSTLTLPPLPVLLDESAPPEPLLEPLVSELELLDALEVLELELELELWFEFPDPELAPSELELDPSPASSPPSLLQPPHASIPTVAMHTWASVTLRTRATSSGSKAFFLLSRQAVRQPR